MILLRSNDLESDSRVDKYINYYSKNKIKFTLVGWRRSGVNFKKEDIIFYNLESGYALGKKNIKNLLKWNLFLLKILWNKRREYKIIHACDFDTILPAILMKILGKKVIFDIFDWYTDCRVIENKFIEKILNKLEKIAVMFSDKVIICEEERKEQIKIDKLNNDKLWILPNIPIFDQKFQKKQKVQKESQIIKLSYVGVFTEDRGLEDLLESVLRSNNIELHIAGFGYLEKKIKNYSQKNERIKFYGKVSHYKGMEIMNNSDIIYAGYYKVNKNNLYAAPNKYYEALFLGKPLLTTVGTLVGIKTQKNNTGFLIEEGLEKLLSFFSEIEKINSEIPEKIKNSTELWEKLYKNYVSDFFEEEYGVYLKNIM